MTIPGKYAILPPGDEMQVMALDYGDARTGVAISDSLGLLAGETAVLPSWNHEKLLASVAVDCLLDKITNDQSGYSHRILYPSLVERSSCRDISEKETE